MHRLRRHRLVVLSALVALAAVAGAADEPAPSEEVTIPSLREGLYRQWTLEPVEPEPESPEHLRSRDSSVERLSLREAVAIALENNPGIAVERLGPRFARADVERVLGAFDPELRAYGEWRRNVAPTGSALAGALTLRERENVFGAALEKLVRSGATVTLAFDSNELDTNSGFIGLRPQYRPELRLSISQPLLKNFGRDLTILLVRSARVSSGIAYHQYRAEVAELVQQVVEAYWGIVQAREGLAAERDGLRLARTLEKENEARVRAGVLPPIAVKEAAAEAATREERVIVAENGLAVATDRLRLLLQQNPAGAFLPREIDPVDSPEVRPVDTSEQDLLEDAVARRPEILRARSEIENRRILAKVKRNNLLPDLDLNARYGLNALAGRAVPQTDFRTGEPRITPFGGNYGEGLDRLVSNDFNSYAAGLELTVPLGNAIAEAEYTQSRIDSRRAELRYREVLSDVTLEVRKSIGDVRSNSKRITASRLARELAEENLEQQKKRYEVGLATTKDILDFQEKLTAARAAEIRALIEYNVSLAALRKASGTLLEQFDVLLDQLPPAPTPLWARF
ncbi:MAG: TolC family protein [Candidatus Binatia bacterium]